MIVKPSISFLLTDGDPQLVTDVNLIYTSMTGNPAYPKAVALLLLVKAALDAFIAALAAAGDGGRALTAAKSDKREALCTLVRSLAGDVADECGGDLTVLLTSGFPIQKPQHFPIGDLPAPAAPTLSLGVHSGDLADAAFAGADEFRSGAKLPAAAAVFFDFRQRVGNGKSFAEQNFVGLISARFAPCRKRRGVPCRSC
jgi:hypothetical protein